MTEPDAKWKQIRVSEQVHRKLRLLFGLTASSMRELADEILEPELDSRIARLPQPREIVTEKENAR